MLHLTRALFRFLPSRCSHACRFACPLRAHFCLFRACALLLLFTALQLPLCAHCARHAAHCCCCAALRARAHWRVVLYFTLLCCLQRCFTAHFAFAYFAPARHFSLSRAFVLYARSGFGLTVWTGCLQSRWDGALFGNDCIWEAGGGQVILPATPAHLPACHAHFREGPPHLLLPKPVDACLQAATCLPHLGEEKWRWDDGQWVPGRRLTCLPVQGLQNFSFQPSILHSSSMRFATSISICERYRPTMPFSFLPLRALCALRVRGSLRTTALLAPRATPYCVRHSTRDITSSIQFSTP